MVFDKVCPKARPPSLSVLERKGPMSAASRGTGGAIGATMGMGCSTCVLLGKTGTCNQFLILGQWDINFAAIAEGVTCGRLRHTGGPSSPACAHRPCGSKDGRPDPGASPAAQVRGASGVTWVLKIFGSEYSHQLMIFDDT